MSGKLKQGRILGIDYGKVRMGLAISDEQRIIATARPFMLTKRKLEVSVKYLVSELENLKVQGSCISEIIVGLPYKLNGTLSPMGEEVKLFSELLDQAVSLKVKLWDERLSTVQAERVMREAKVSRKKRTRFIDSLSAVIVLQSYLDHQGGTLFPQVENY